MKKLISILAIYLLIIIFSVSCNEPHYVISNIRFLGASLDYYGDKPRFNHYNSTSVFEKDIIFVISTYKEYIANLINIELIQNCYALTKRETCDNELLIDTYSITFDRQFIFNNDTIDAGQNIFSIDKIKNEINIFETAMSFESAGADEVIDFSDDFINKVKFDSGTYQVTFSCKTSDDKEFTEQIDVEFKL
ncbi:hypothetical protein ACE01N_20025 [Saccharicrinis sp. FJH2]|uniref:hypothetical protein n=1 Tax=Saccharicrinis sp. FJH65 TaxID=3344659 RepID=UPI0035F4743D